MVSLIPLCAGNHVSICYMATSRPKFPLQVPSLKLQIAHSFCITGRLAYRMLTLVRKPVTYDNCEQRGQN